MTFENKIYTLNSSTTIKVVGEEPQVLVVEIGETPSLTARISKQDLDDGITAGYISEASSNDSK